MPGVDGLKGHSHTYSLSSLWKKEETQLSGLEGLG